MSLAHKYGADYIPVLIVGSNPSNASHDNSAFAVGTKSRATIDSWFDNDNDYLMKYVNIVDYKTAGNKPLTRAEIKNNLPDIKNNFQYWVANYNIIAVGKTAQDALDMAEIEHFKMWHPSGLCRKWNDKEASKAKIQEMLEWIKKKN